MEVEPTSTTGFNQYLVGLIFKMFSSVLEFTEYFANHAYILCCVYFFFFHRPKSDRKRKSSDAGVTEKDDTDENKVVSLKH